MGACCHGESLFITAVLHLTVTWRQHVPKTLLSHHTSLTRRLVPLSHVTDLKENSRACIGLVAHGSCVLFIQQPLSFSVSQRFIHLIKMWSYLRAQTSVRGEVLLRSHRTGGIKSSKSHLKLNLRSSKIQFGYWICATFEVIWNLEVCWFWTNAV